MRNGEHGVPSGGWGYQKELDLICFDFQGEEPGAVLVLNE